MGMKVMPGGFHLFAPDAKKLSTSEQTINLSSRENDDHKLPVVSSKILDGDKMRIGFINADIPGL